MATPTPHPPIGANGANGGGIAGRIATKVEVLTGPQGGGKTREMRNAALANPGRYLFAAPTIELVEELAAQFERTSGLEVRAAHSRSKGRGTAKERLDFARDDIVRRGLAHAILLTTHETLMAADLSEFVGWHARIDEAPAAVQAGRIDIRLLRPWFKATFTLTGAQDSEWSVLSLKGTAADWKSVQASPANGLGEFQKQAAHLDRVFVKATDWDSADEIDWFSMWTPLALSAFGSVQVAGSSYTDSVGYHAAKTLFGDLLDFSEREVREARTGCPSITIHFFTRGHRGGTNYWDKSDGRLMIKKVCDHLGRVLPARAFWSGNDVVQHLMEHRIKGKLISPTAAGLNKHGARIACAYIFSAKPTPNDAAIKSALRLTDAQILKAREDDAVAQFVMRGAIRNPSYDGPYDIYLYEEAQAQRLQTHLSACGFTTVDVVGVEEAGILDTPRHAAPPKTRLTEADVAARKAAKSKTEADRLKKKRAAKALAEGRKPHQPGNPKLRAGRTA